MCKDRHVHIPKPKVEISEDNSLNSGIKKPNRGSANEVKDRVHSKQSDINRQKLAMSESRAWDAEEWQFMCI